MELASARGTSRRGSHGAAHADRGAGRLHRRAGDADEAGAEFAAGFPGAVLVVQHMPGTFTPQFAEQLAAVSQLPVKQAENGEILRAGQVYVCPGRQPSAGSSSRTHRARWRPAYRRLPPSIDVTLESVAALAGANATVAILTGMGSDGARGALAIQGNGGLVLAQDESTSVIFGMPAEAIKTGAVEHVLPLQQIAAAITRRVAGNPGNGAGCGIMTRQGWRRIARRMH